ncbi:Positive regulator of purine utilization [Metarhizium brunneum]|uniref:Positive regulator of purine utilization n=1 Tax=Metarhizium brunneum TaxID=500148 RepID=A0A7D5V2A4_9HYPO
MPRTSFSRNPLLRVSRPVSACSRCRAAKVKCDGKLPACTACEKAGRDNECSAANDQFARGKERSYVAALELRIEKLERRLDYAKSRKDSVGQHEADGTTNTNLTEAERRDSLAAIRAAIHRKAARNREDLDVNSLVSDFGILSVDATTRDFEPSLGNITFARLVLAVTTKDSLPEPPQSMLPSRQAANTIVQYFMANIYSLFPCFSETALLTILDDVYRQDDRVIRDSDYWLLFLVLAIGSTSQSRKINDEYYVSGVNFVCRAMSYADRALGPGYVTQIQSLLLLTIYSMLDPAHFDTWHLIGFTSRAVVDLGLHQDPPTSSVSDRSALDMRRKIFYCTYALDRAISMAHARSFSFADESINVAFPQMSILGDKPANSKLISGPQSADPALLLFQLRRAQSYWYQVLYQSEQTPLPNPTGFLWQMCLDMREWQESLPNTLPPGIRQMFEQELRYSYVYCIAPSARAPQITNYIRVLIFEYSLEYLNNMYDIAYSGLNSAFYTYHDALKVYFMANQLLAVLRDAQDLLVFGAHVPPPPAPPGSAPAPPIPRRHMRPDIPVGGNLNLDRTIWCLERIPKTLQLYGMKWEDALMLERSFVQLSNGTVDRLRNLRQLSGHNQYQNGVQSMTPSGVVQLQGQQAPAGMRWVGVDATQMMHGGPRQ